MDRTASAHQRATIFSGAVLGIFIWVGQANFG